MNSIQERLVKSAISTFVPVVKNNQEAIDEFGKKLIADIKLQDGETEGVYILTTIKDSCIVCEAMLNEKSQIVRIGNKFTLGELIEKVIRLFNK